MAQRRFGAGRGGNADFCRLYGGRRYAGVRIRARQPADGDAPAQHPQRLRSPDVHERLRQVVQSLLRLFRYDQERHLRHTQGRVHDPVSVGVDLRPQELVRLPADLRFAATAPERLLVCGRHAPAAALRRRPIRPSSRVSIPWRRAASTRTTRCSPSPSPTGRRRGPPRRPSRWSRRRRGWTTSRS